MLIWPGSPRVLVCGACIFIVCLLAWRPDHWHNDDRSSSGHSLAGAHPCNYGSQPGRWTGSPGVLTAQQLLASPPFWQTFEPRCRVKTLLQPLIEAGRAAASSDQGEEVCSGSTAKRSNRLLLLGDSVDRTIARDLCHTAAGKAVNQRTENGEACMEVWLPDDGWACRLPGITIATQAFWGVSPKGPYSRNRTGNASSRILQAMSSYRTSFGGPPDVVVAGPLLWDLARWKLLDSDLIMASDQLPEALLAEWRTSASNLLRQIKEAAPSEAIVAVRTLYFPRLDPAPASAGKLRHPTITRHAHVAQLNAALRQLAASHGLQVIDLELLTSHFFDASQYLIDNTHPAPWLSRAVVNLCINMIAERDGAHLKDPRRQLRAAD